MCVYIDALLNIIIDSKVGCFVGHLYVVAVAYADDMVLLAPMTRAMRHWLSVCDDSASKYDVVFNASKSKCLSVWYSKPMLVDSYFMGHVPSTHFCIGGKVIGFVDSWPNLGHILNVRDYGADMEKNSLCFVWSN